MTGGPVEAPGVSACLVDLAGRTFAVKTSQAREVRILDGYTAVPLAPPPVLGVTNLRGAIIPLLDLHTLLGLPARPPTPTVSTLVVEAHAVRVALVVDRVVGIESLDEAPDPGESVADASAFAHPRLRRGDDAVVLLDVVKIVESLAGPKLREVR